VLHVLTTPYTPYKPYKGGIHGHNLTTSSTPITTSIIQLQVLQIFTMSSKLNQKVIDAIIAHLKLDPMGRKGNQDRFTLHLKGGGPSEVQLCHRKHYSFAKVGQREHLYVTEGGCTRRVIPVLAKEEHPPHDILEEVHHDAVE
jgi:hypothetical protein